ncbi:MAG: DUF5668 domain-containing protein [Candidatus Zixiibacteriota bacterium]
MTPARFRWGMLLVLLGAVLLLRNLDVINNNFWEDFLIYLPVLLIAIGIEKIFTKSKFQILSYLTSVAFFLGGLYLVYVGSMGGSDLSFFSQTSYKAPADPTVKELHASLHLTDGDLTVRDATDDLVDGQFREFTHKPEITYAVQDGSANVTFEGGKRRLLGNAIRVETDAPDDWYLSFSNLVPLTLECLGKGSDMHLNLSTTPLKDLKLEADEGSVYVKLGTLLPQVEVSLRGENSDIRLRLPSDAGIRINGVDDREYLQQVGLKPRDGAFVNDGYDTLNNKINVNLDDRLSSLSIDYY